MIRVRRRHYPLILAPAAGGGAISGVLFADVLPSSNLILVGTMTLGVVVAGFTATQRSMILSMGGSRVLRFLVREGFYNDVLNRLSFCIYAASFVTIVSVPGIFLEKCSLPWMVWLFFWISAVALVIMLMIENERLMSRILARFVEDQS